MLDEKDIGKVFQGIEKDFGAIHVVVNMASTGTMDWLLYDSIDTWQDTMEVMHYNLIKHKKLWIVFFFNFPLKLNVIAPAICCKLAIDNMKKYNVEGHIINIGGSVTKVIDF